MEILKHRVNSLNQIDLSSGLEIDIRDFNNELVLSHDYPNTKSIKFDDFLKGISKKIYYILVVNIFLKYC